MKESSMWKLPPDSEALEEIDKAFQQYKEDLEDDYSDCSSNVTPSISQSQTASRAPSVYGHTPNFEPFDAKAEKYDSKNVSIVTINKNKCNIGVISVIVLSSTLAFVSILALVLYPLNTKSLVPVPTDIQTAIVPSNKAQSSDIEQTVLGNIEYKVYPSSYSIFAKNSDVDVIENPVPILFDITRGPGLSFFPRALSKCLKFKQISNRRELKSVQSGEYFHVDSLCDFANTHEGKSNGRKLNIFVVLRNPLVSSILLYRQITNPQNKYFDKELSALTFQEYMNDSSRTNLLTRSILCKSKDEELTEEDFNNAKEFLSTRCIVKIYDGRGEKALKTFLDMFKNLDGGLSMIQDAEECIDNALTNAQVITRSISDTQAEIRNNMQDLAAANNYDMKLYFHILNLSNS